MQRTVTFHVTGIADLTEKFRELEQDFGAKDARRVLQKAVHRAMKETILPRAKANASRHIDSGLLYNSLIATARKPTNKDRRSVYVNPSDIIVGYVQTKPIPKKLKRKVSELYGNLNTASTRKLFKEKQKKFMEASGYFYDARAVANEFGTAKRAATPFLDPAISEGKDDALRSLKESFALELRKYYDKKGR